MSRQETDYGMTQTDQLSKREKEVVELLLQGKSNKQIALALGISNRTVEFHLKNVYAKLQVSSRAEAILKLGKSTGGAGAEKPVESTVEARLENADSGSKLISQRPGAASFRGPGSLMRKETEMRNRWFVYLLAGLAFGIVEWVLMDFLSLPSTSPNLSRVIMKAPTIVQAGLGLLLALVIYGAWFAAAIPVMIHELNQSKSLAITTIAIVVFWCAAIVGYYGFYAYLLLFVGLPHMDFMVVRRMQLGAEWWLTFQHVILKQWLEGTVVVTVTGAIAGPLIAMILRRFLNKRLRGIAIA
jgi:DNA-binding CsgD family transcriptional regulator